MSPVIEKIIKRNGQIVDFVPSKIVNAVEKAFFEVLQDRHTNEAESIANQVLRSLLQRATPHTPPTVELVQDIVERALMERGFFDVSKAYIIYRYEHAKMREQRKEEIIDKIAEKSLRIKKRDGSEVAFDEEKIIKTLSYAMKGYENVVNVRTVVSQVRQEMYEGISTKDIHEVLIMVVRSFIERDPGYAVVAARLLLQSIYREVIGNGIDYSKLHDQYREAFKKNIAEGVRIGKLDSRMLEFDLDMLSHALKIDLDSSFKYLGLQTLHTNYLMRDNHTRQLLEAPQMFWMRVAMGTALVEKTPEDRAKWAVEFYTIMAEMYYTPSSPTLYHSGFSYPQLSSCFLMTVPDDLHHIFKHYSDGAQLLKYAGGNGTDWTSVRGTGALIKTTGVESQGVIPFLKIENDVTISINRSGRRRGAAAVYLEMWHFDVEDFIELRKNTGDERRRTHDLNTAIWIPDLFMKRLQEDGEWTLFSPDEVPELHEVYGTRFEECYVAYEKKAGEGNIRLFKTVRAKDLWRKALTMLYETGHPWITWKDPSNIRSPQDHVGVVHCSNLCTEITLNTSAEETAVCNLGSLNMARFIENGRFSQDIVARVVPVAMRMLDNVIDINYYATEDAKRSNMRHRPVGLGIRGLQDALYKLNINFDSEAAVAFSDESMEIIAYHTILASSMLAKERGTYETYRGSKWDRGILPQDTIELLEKERGLPVEVPRNERLTWSVVRDAIRQYGMRNSNTMANAPTATTANIAGCFPTIEPVYKNIYVKSNMAGDFMVVNEFLVEDLKARGLWHREMLEQLKFHDGSVQEIADMPVDLKEKYKEVFEIAPQWLIKAAAFRGRWIDQSQSLNIFYGGTSGKDLSQIYQYAWRLGLKTTYYLRTLGASRIEKSTIDLAKFGGTSKTDIKRADDSIPSPISVVREEMVVMSTPSSTTSFGQYAMSEVFQKAVVAPVVVPEVLASSQPLTQPIHSHRDHGVTEIISGDTCESCSA